MSIPLITKNRVTLDMELSYPHNYDGLKLHPYQLFMNLRRTQFWRDYFLPKEEMFSIQGKQLIFKKWYQRVKFWTLLKPMELCKSLYDDIAAWRMTLHKVWMHLIFRFQNGSIFALLLPQSTTARNDGVCGSWHSVQSTFSKRHTIVWKMTLTIDLTSPLALYIPQSLLGLYSAQ